MILGAQATAQSAATAAAGGAVTTSPTASGSTKTTITNADVTLNPSQLDQIKTHLADIRRRREEVEARRSRTRATDTGDMLCSDEPSEHSWNDTIDHRYHSFRRYSPSSNRTNRQTSDLLRTRRCSSPISRGQRGDYRTALSGYLRLLDSPDAASVLEPIALRTGELYETTELTRDGAVPQFSPDGKYILYENGTDCHPRHPHRQHRRPDAVVSELRGSGASFSPDSAKVAYWKAARCANAPRLHRQRRRPAAPRLFEIGTGAGDRRSTPVPSCSAPSSSAPATPSFFRARRSRPARARFTSSVPAGPRRP